MKLSEAMMLGSTTCKMKSGDWNSCALGCSANAVGIPLMYGNDANGSSFERYELIVKVWPWLRAKRESLSNNGSFIWNTFDDYVCKGTMTLEQLADEVRIMEPSCGECNRFDCTCQPEAVPEPTLEAVHD